MSRRRVRAEPEEAAAEAQDNGPVLRKSARLAGKPQKVWNFGTRAAKPKANENENASANGNRNGGSRRGGRSTKNQGPSSSNAAAVQEEEEMNVEEDEQVAPADAVESEEQVAPTDAVESEETAETMMALKDVQAVDALHVEALRVYDSDDDMESDGEFENRQKKEAERIRELKKNAEVGEEYFEPDLENGICAYMKMLDRVVRVPEPERALFSKEGLELLKLGDNMGHYAELDGIRVGKPEVVLATTILHCNQLLKLANSPIFLESILRWDPIGAKEIAYLIYVFARIKCPLIGPQCFPKTEDLLTKYSPNTDWQPVWRVLNGIRIPGMYMEGSTPNGPHFELADFFVDSMLPKEGTTHMNIIYFFMVFKERFETGALVF